MTTIQHVRPDGLANAPTYTQVVASASGRTVYISGQVSADAKGAPVAVGDLGGQTTQVMTNLGLALASVGATFADVVKITTFVVGYQPEQRAVIAAARGAFFEGLTPPASTLVGVSALAAPEYLIEIEAVAVID